MTTDIDRRSNGYKARKEGMMAKTDAEVVRIYGNRWLKSKVNNWMASQPLFIQALFGDLCWES